MTMINQIELIFNIILSIPILFCNTRTVMHVIIYTHFNGWSIAVDVVRGASLPNMEIIMTEQDHLFPVAFILEIGLFVVLIINSGLLS